MSQQFQRELFERAEDFDILLDDAVIMELSFSATYTAAIEAKQVGEQKRRQQPDRPAAGALITV